MNSSKNQNKFNNKRVVFISEPRSKECFEKCGNLPCNCGSGIGPVMHDCICVCQKHPSPRLDITTLRTFTSNDKI